MKKKAQRTKLPVLAFEAESWPVDIKFRKEVPASRRAEKPVKSGASRTLRVVTTRSRSVIPGALLVTPSPKSVSAEI